MPEGLFPPYACIFYIKNDWTADRCLFISDKFEAPSLKFYPSKLLGEYARYRTETG